MQDTQTIRLIDRYIGILLCFILSILNKFRKKEKTANVKNILLLELFEMGAVVMAYPSIEYIYNNLKNPNIYVLCLKNSKVIWSLSNYIPEENIFVIDDKNLLNFFKSLIKNILILRKKDIDIILDFELFIRLTSIISFLINPKFIAGFYKYEMEGLYRGSYYDIKCAFNQNAHISKNFLALTKTALSKEQHYPNFKGKVESSELGCIQYKRDEFLRKKVLENVKKCFPDYIQENRIILISPDVGRTLEVRNWPKENFVQIIKEILTRYDDIIVLLIGVKENQEICSSIQKMLDDKRCINFCSKTETLKELLELMGEAELVISNDNGNAHFPALTGTKTIALFSTDSPYVYGPFGKCIILYSYFHCSPCICAYNHKKTSCKNNLCLKAIEPEKVLFFVDKILENSVEFNTINNTTKYF